MPLSILIAGGGTAGHLYPGVAVARELMTRVPDATVTFVGTAAGIEARIVPREGFTLETIRSAGLKGKSVASLARGVGLLPASAIDAWGVISRRRPSVVIGVGGYSSGPVVALAAVRGVPTLLMEQNALPGLTNRLLAPLVSAAAVTYSESVSFFGQKAFVSGNPVRPEFFEEAYEQPSSPPGAARVLVFGGSQGAHAINMAMVEAAARLVAAAPALAITHQTGERDVEVVRDGYRRAGLQARVESFLFGMDREMKAADVVVCRSGATTLAELPAATDDHQRKNAEALVKQGAARMIEQRELTGDRLSAEILALATDGEMRRRMAEAAGRLARPDAARVIVDKVLGLASSVSATGSPRRDT
jgi:UDP-N-acetylglucosamine--N-acetylmuramyl-(pentapeptide) pyrophosphoryl-undecaprenol N-acetylglucosamine transferase